MITTQGLLFFLFIVRVVPALIEVQISDGKIGTFEVIINGTRWLQSDHVQIQKDHKLLTTFDGTLIIYQIDREAQKHDNLGDFEELRLSYAAASEPDTVLMIASIKIYDSSVVFLQQFPQSILGTSVNTSDLVATAFPTFITGSPSSLGPAGAE